MAQELDTGGIASAKIKHTANWMYKHLGFKMIDRLGKNVIIGTALRTAKSSVTTPKSRADFMKKYGQNYDEQELSMLMADLRANKMTTIVKQHVMAEVMEIQPLGRSQMPQGYLDHPNGRVFYQFRTWGLKQLDLARRGIFDEIKSGNPKRIAMGVQSLVLMTAYVGGGNVAITELQRLFTGQDSKLFDDEGGMPLAVLGQVLGNMGINKYGIETSLKRGNLDQFMLGFVPPAIEVPGQMGMSLIQRMFADTDEEKERWNEEARKASGGLGRLANMWFFGGAEKENEKVLKLKMSNMGLSQ